MLEKYRSAAADALLQSGAVRFRDEGFLLKLHQEEPDAPRPPHYFDLRRLRSFPEQRKHVVEYLYRVIGSSGAKFNVLADVPTAITPVVTTLSDHTEVGFVSPRPAKGYGTQSSIDGDFEDNWCALLVDDVLSTGGSLFDAINALQAGIMDGSTPKRLRVHSLVVVIDREQGGREQLTEGGYRVISCFKQRELLLYYKENSSIDSWLIDRALAYPDTLARYRRAKGESCGR